MLLFSAVYFVSYLTRINYAAVISAIIAEEGISRSVAALAVTGAFVTYGVGQLLSGALSDRVQPTHLVSLALVCTSFMNFAVVLAPSAGIRTAVWCVNGLAQAFIWPPLMKLVPALLDDEHKLAAGVRINAGGHVGNISVYVIAPLFIRFTGWRGMFVFSGTVGIACAIVWTLFCGKFRIDTAPAEKSVREDGEKSEFPLLLLAAIGVTIVLQGAMRDGVTTWIPSYILETFSLGADVSVLAGVVMPVFALFCLSITEAIYKKVQSVKKCSAVAFALAGAASALLPLTASLGVVATVLDAAIIVGCMHGINLLQTCMLPHILSKNGKLGFTSGALNGCVYVGSAISTYGSARLSEAFGWSGTIGVWAAACAVGALICLSIKKGRGL